MIDNPKIQRSAVAVLSLLALFLLAKTIAEVKEWPYIGKDVPTQSTITVSGKGEVLEIPDIATFSFGVTEESFDVAKAQEDSAKAVNAIISFLEENGVEKRDIKTSGYNIYPRYEYEKYGYPVPPGKQTLGAYVVTQSISVKVRKIAEAGKLISGIGERGATEISGLSFSIDKEEEFKKEAREKAIAEAKENAKTLAKDLGVRLVRIISFSENGSYPSIFYSAKASFDGFGRGGETAPEIPAGETSIISNVSITYEVR